MVHSSSLHKTKQTVRVWPGTKNETPPPQKNNLAEPDWQAGVTKQTLYFKSILRWKGQKWVQTKEPRAQEGSKRGQRSREERLGEGRVMWKGRGIDRGDKPHPRPCTPFQSDDERLPRHRWGSAQVGDAVDGVGLDAGRSPEPHHGPLVPDGDERGAPGAGRRARTGLWVTK